LKPQPACSASSNVACDGAVPPNLVNGRLERRKTRVTNLETALGSIPPTLERDDVEIVETPAKVNRRRGEASVTLKLTPSDAMPGAPALKLTHRVPFESSELADGKKSPSDVPLGTAVARAVLGDVANTLDAWLRRSTTSPSRARSSAARVRILRCSPVMPRRTGTYASSPI
jgi:hypothetical protein